MQESPVSRNGRQESRLHTEQLDSVRTLTIRRNISEVRVVVDEAESKKKPIRRLCVPVSCPRNMASLEPYSSAQTQDILPVSPACRFSLYSTNRIRSLKKLGASGAGD
jgi:hypothetical protein